MGGKQSKKDSAPSAAAAPATKSMPGKTSGPPASGGGQSPTGERNRAKPGDEATFKKKYQLKSVLGNGNYSVVRKAVDLETGDNVAVKCIDKRKLSKEDDEALKIEVAILNELKHPNIITLYDWFEDPKTYYIVTEYMQGGELFDRIVKKEFYSEEDAQKVVRTLADVVQFCHKRGIAHRDLKPENILMKDEKDDSAIKIADFGFARKVGEGLTTACGTPGYVAPEIINGKPYGMTVDIWSLGVIVYILLPFYNANQAQLFKLIREGKFAFDSPYWDPISQQAKDLIRGCLTVDINKRLSIDQVLAHPWVASKVSAKDITPALRELQKFNARRKLRAGIKAAIAANRLADMAGVSLRSSALSGPILHKMSVPESKNPNEPKGPLCHLRVLELGGLAPAPYCGLILKQFGADVIHITRASGAPEDPAGLSHGKRSLALDLKAPEGIQVLRRMCKNADVLIDPYRPGVLEKLGLGPQEVLLKDNPRLIVVRITGWGQTGPYASAAGHDINYIALTGALSMFARSATDPPLPPINILGDFAGGGMLAAMGVLLALHERSKSGLGQVIDSAMVDGAAHLATFLFRFRTTGQWNDTPGSNVLDGGAPFYGTYVCSDGKFLSVGSIEPQFYELLLAGLGLKDEMPGHQMERKYFADHKRIIAGRIMQKPRDHWAKVFAPNGPYKDACVAPVLTMQEAIEHPANVERKVFAHGHTGKKEDVFPNPGPRLSRTPGFNLPYWRAEPAGKNNRTVLFMYGFTAKEIDDLENKGIIREAKSKL